jgi:hypothetical protein
MRRVALQRWQNEDGLASLLSCERRALVSAGIGGADLGSPFHDAQFAAKVSAANC